MINTLGLLEVYGFVAGVEAMDAMLKSANVRLLSHSVTPSALVTIVIEGDLAACRAALDAGCAATEYIGGKVLCQKVLGRPERDTERMVLSFCGNDSELHQEILQSYGVASKMGEVPVDSAPQLIEVFKEESVFEADNEPIERHNSQMDEDENERISQQPGLEIEVLDLEESSLEALTEEAIHHDEIEAAERVDVSRKSSELPDDEEDLSQEELEVAMVEAIIAEANLTNEESSIAQEVAEETRNELAITELERMAHASIEQENENTADEPDLTDELLAEESVADDNVANNEIAEAKDELEVEQAAEKVEETEAHAELAEVITEETTIWQAVAEAERKEHINAVREQSDALGQDDTEEQGEVESLEALGLDEADLEELLEDIDIDFDPEMEEIFKLVASFLRDKGEKGSNLLEMSNRLGIDLAKLKRVLHRGVRQKLLRKNSNRYFINL